MFCQPIKPPKALQLFSQSCQEKDVGNTMRLRECNPYSARFPELRLVFADACEAYTGLRSNTPFGGVLSLAVFTHEGRTTLNQPMKGKVFMIPPGSQPKGKVNQRAKLKTPFGGHPSTFFLKIRPALQSRSRSQFHPRSKILSGCLAPLV